MLRTINLGDSLTTAAAALTAYGVGDLEEVYVTICSAGNGVGTCKVQYSVDGTNWLDFSSTSVTGGTYTLVGPLPPCLLIRGNTTAHGTSGTISYRAGGNVAKSSRMLTNAVTCGANVNIDATPNQNN